MELSIIQKCIASKMEKKINIEKIKIMWHINFP